MKRAISSIIFGGATICAFAMQGSFTIVRPFDGSKVREMVKVLFPKNSVPEGSGYVGIFIDGQFLEAVAPKESADKKYYQYLLDTKAIADGSHKLEAKLYVDYSNQPRIVDTSSVDITVANKSSIPVPEDGFQLRYKFVPGTERIYRMQHRTIENVISEDDQKKQGSRPFQIQEDGETIRMLYACDNAYGNGPAKFYPENMSGIYMRITSTGREVFGSIPDYFGLDGAVGGGQKLDLFAAYPLPTLPSKGVKPGDSWQANFQQGVIDLPNAHTQKSVVEVTPARGELLGVEWEMGHPCAKIRNSIAEGSATKINEKTGKASDQIADRKISLEETIWFALDTGIVVKYFRDETIEGKANFGFQSGGGGQSGGPSGPGAPGAPPQGSRGGKGGGGVGPGDFHQTDRQKGRQGGGRPAGPGMPGAPGMPGGQGRPGSPGMPGGQGGQGGQQQGQNAFVRIRIQELFVLEK
jgi:hypothetical protein